MTLRVKALRSLRWNPLGKLRSFGRTVYLVHPEVHPIIKFFPHNPPRRGDIVLVKEVEGIYRCEVVADPPLSWEGLTWTFKGPLRVIAKPKRELAEGVFA